jgi:putative transposase
MCISFWSRPIPTGCAARWRGCTIATPALFRRDASAAVIFWQNRFGAVAMDEEHLAAAVRYVSLNPVRARLVERAQDWRWSSTRAHLRGKDDGLTELAPIKARFPDFADLLDISPEADLFTPLRAAESIGRPLGDNGFFSRIERLTKRSLKPGKRGPKPMDQNDARRREDG